MGRGIGFVHPRSLTVERPGPRSRRLWRSLERQKSCIAEARRPGGVVFALLDPVVRNDRRHLGEVAKEALERLSVDSEIRRGSQQLGPPELPDTGPREEPIVATAYTQLKERMRGSGCNSPGMD